MCIVKIKSWYGRNANNFMQIAHACEYAFEQHRACKILIPPHKLLNSTTIFNPHEDEQCNCDKTIHYGSDVFFFEANNIKNVLGNWALRKKMLNKYALNLINSNIIQHRDEKISDCVVHIRSGDVHNTTKGGYKKQPLSYYTTCIDMMLKDNKNILVVHEDKKIDVFQKLFDKYSENNLVKFKSSNVIDDLNSMMRCEHIITSVGTFGMMAYCLSTTIKHVYVSQERVDKFDLNDDDDVTLHIVEFVDK